MTQLTEIKLRVLEALQDDAYKGVARIDTEVMKILGLRRGDIISIKGERETVAIVDRSYPADINNFEHYNNLKDKTFHVKLRMVGNSHAISIPKEIVEFMHAQERMMDDMVRLCFEDIHKLSLNFGGDNDPAYRN